jgi:hypothetical protein
MPASRKPLRVRYAETDQMGRVLRISSFGWKSAGFRRDCGFAIAME